MKLNLLKHPLLLFIVATALVGAFDTAIAQQPAKKPNILIIWGDDIGYWNVSAYNQGMMVNT